MAQQTTVEWFFKHLLESEPDILEWQKIFEQAKEMEKDQICEAWQHGKQQTFLGLGKVLTSEEYYNETYNK